MRLYGKGHERADGADDGAVVVLPFEVLFRGRQRAGARVCVVSADGVLGRGIGDRDVAEDALVADVIWPM